MANYPDRFDPTPEKIYSVKMVGGEIPDKDGERYSSPRIQKNQYDKKDGTGKYWGWNVTIFAKEVKYVDGKPETDDRTLGEYTFWIPEEVREPIDEYFNAGIMKFYLIRKSIWYKNKKGKNKTKSQYQVSAGLSGLKSGSEPVATPKSVKEDIPFEQYEEDDKVAFQEDIKPTVKVKTTINQTPITSSSMDMQILVDILQKIEIHLGKTIDYWGGIDGSLVGIEERIKDISNSFKYMLDKFKVKIKKVEE